MTTGSTVPVRLCCGQRHHGPVCPDGKVMCCLCFNRVEQSGLALEGGSRVDVCIPCRTDELARIDGQADAP
jgi:hypothetical protein